MLGVGGRNSVSSQSIKVTKFIQNYRVRAAFPNEVDKSFKIKNRENEEALKCLNFQNWWRNQKVTDPIVRWPLWVPSVNHCRRETTIMILLFHQELRQKLIEETSDFSISHAFLWKSH
ncbi:hypothetical protein TNCV_1121281 [Trichonephila clavipes]|uniref:Uncharacterized protein n=1 Tax=Trichonephila clavipes TaxID=2585209 RepID=A0A8X6SVQ2_TRICX|nr:hypothetical protein TNCV_1121281 [Trichonephila clavipes]